MTKILVLKSEEGIIVTKKDLEEIYYRFYNKLYKAHKELFDLTKLKTNVLNTLPKKFIEAIIPKLEMPIITKELQVVANAMAKGKSHGPD